MHKPVRTETLAIRIEPRLKQFLRDKARNEKVSVSDILHELVEKYIESEEQT